MQVGMLRALYERGIHPDLLVGTSAGAVAVIAAKQFVKPGVKAEDTPVLAAA